MHFAPKKMSARRIAAMAITIGCHLSLLIVMLEPARHRTDIVPKMWNDIDSLKLRLISSPWSASMPPPYATINPPSKMVAAKLASRHVASNHPPKPPSGAINATPPSTLAATSRAAIPSIDASAAATWQSTKNPGAVGDGGFHERLLNAERANEIHGIPGSDRPIVRGIPLADPMTQGIGHVLRQTQRLFGIANHHCVDVEVLESLSTEALIARHLTPADVKKEEQRYDCNSPPGLHF